MSFSVRSPREGAPKILSTLASLLQAHGGAVAVDSHAFTLTAAMPAPAASPEEQGAEQGDGATAQLDNGQSLGPGRAEGSAHVRSESAGESRAGKRQRLSLDVEGGESVRSGPYELRMSLLQESKAICAVSASVAGSVPDATALRFTVLCREIEQDIAHILACA